MADDEDFPRNTGVGFKIFGFSTKWVFGSAYPEVLITYLLSGKAISCFEVFG